jgi:hypothetical protein
MGTSNCKFEQWRKRILYSPKLFFSVDLLMEWHKLQNLPSQMISLSIRFKFCSVILKLSIGNLSNDPNFFLILGDCIFTGFVTRLTRRVPLVEKELSTLPEHPRSPPVFGGVRVARSLVLFVCFGDRCLSFFFWPSCCPVVLRFTDSDWHLRTLLVHKMFWNVQTVMVLSFEKYSLN